MLQTILRKLTLVAAVASVALSFSAVAGAVTIAAASSPTAQGPGVSSGATKEDPFFPDSHPFDFRAFQSASDATTCGGKPFPAVSLDNSYAVCVGNEVRTIHPEDRIAFNVKVSLAQDGRKHVLGQFSLVSAVGLPIMYETSERDVYLGQEAHVDAASVALQSTGPGEATSLVFDPVGHTAEGELLVQTRIVLASRATLKTYETTDGRALNSVDGHLAKGTYTAPFNSGSSQTYQVGDEEIEVTVLSLPRL
jgi:hypothetical protein